MQSGFSVKELLMALALIAILCAAAIPPYYTLKQMRTKTAPLPATPQTNQAPLPGPETHQPKQ